MKELPDNVFRGNVGAVILNSRRNVLGLERRDIAHAWQLPQGGLDVGEAPLAAVFREVKEETGISEEQLSILAEYPEWLAYELEEGARTGKHGRGQVQKWFFFQFTGNDSDIDLESAAAAEFSAWQWMNIDELVEGVPAFRKQIYLKLADFLHNDLT